MYDKLIFYCHFGNGDIFESREFVKKMRELIPAKEYYYAHGKDPRILLDIPELKFTPITPEMQPRVQVYSIENTLYINTWIGITGEYLLPGIGCTVERLRDMYNDILAKLSDYVLTDDIINYIPRIDYEVYNPANVQHFFMNHNRYSVLIDNGMVQSMQAMNFPMDNIICSVADNHKHMSFFVTHPLSEPRENIYNTNDIIGRNGFDLPEISYLSTFCGTLIGRNSGPHVFAQVRDNVMNPSKKLLSFTYESTGSSFVVNTDVKIRKYWSNATHEETVIEAIERTLDE